MVSIKEQLPRIFPTDEVRVDGEEFLYTVIDTGEDTIKKTSYTLEKAPISVIEEVTGTHNNKQITFTQGSDYELSDDKEDVVWLTNGGREPDVGTTFTVQYLSESVIGRYIETSGQELTNIEDELSEAVSARLVASAPASNRGQATDDELDEIGKLFGVLGKRRGRDDGPYRAYLRSIVQSFNSNGTPEEIKTAIAAATNVPIEDIEIREDFENVSYSISVNQATSVSPSLIRRVADIADPSGVEFSKTRFSIEKDVTTAGESIIVLQPTTFSETLTSGESTNKGQLDTATDTNVVSESITVTTTSRAWDTGNWDSMKWAKSPGLDVSIDPDPDLEP